MNHASDQNRFEADGKALAAPAAVSLEHRDPRHEMQGSTFENAAKRVHDHKVRRSNDILLAFKIAADG